MEQHTGAVKFEHIDLTRIANLTAAVVKERVGVIKIRRDLYGAAPQHLHVCDAQIRAAAEAGHVLNDAVPSDAS